MLCGLVWAGKKNPVFSEAQLIPQKRSTVTVTDILGKTNVFIR